MRVTCVADGSQKIRIYYTVSDIVELFDDEFEENLVDAVLNNADVEVIDRDILVVSNEDTLIPGTEYYIEVIAKVSVSGTCAYYHSSGYGPMETYAPDEVDDVDLVDGLIEDIDTKSALASLNSAVESIRVDIGGLFDFDNLEIDEY